MIQLSIEYCYERAYVSRQGTIGNENSLGDFHLGELSSKNIEDYLGILLREERLVWTN